MPRNTALNPYPPKIPYTQTCKKCQGTLYRVTTGNLIDYRHQGAEFTCPKPQTPSTSSPSLEELFLRLVNSFLPETDRFRHLRASQDQFALDA